MMIFLEIFCITVLSAYFLLIFSFIAGFIKIKDFKSLNSKNRSPKLKLSVIIPFKNEANNLSRLVNSLINQTLEDEYYEVIFVNDHSVDKSEVILSELIKKRENFKILNTNNTVSGKKNALSFGIKNALNNIIVTTDADCTHPKNWLKMIYLCFDEQNPKMLIAPVIMQGTSFFGKIQSAEFMSLTASTAGAAGIGHPIMCNGANLAFKKNIFFEMNDGFNSREISGDDIFLLHNIKKKYSEDIKYLKSPEASVQTYPTDNLKDFFKQRIRWTSKSRSYKDADTILTSLLVLTTNLILLFSGLRAFYLENYELFIWILFLKFLPDTVLFIISSSYFKQIKLLYYFLIFLPLYPFYILTTVILTVIKREVSWK